VRITISRVLAVTLAAVFSAYHLVLASVSLTTYADPVPVVVCGVLYAVVTVLALWPSRSTIMPLWSACAALAVAVVLPVQLSVQLDPEATNGYATWYVAAVGTLMVIVSARRRRGLAWTGVGFLAVHAVVWGGPAALVDTGVIGSVSWVAFSTAMSATLARAGRETREFVLAEQEAADWQAAQEAHLSERQVRLAQTGRTARPMLQAIVDQEGDLTEEQRSECLYLEAGIRDEIRGRRLLDDRVRQAVLEARRRGTVVSLLDEGGIDDLSEADLHRVHGQLAEAVRGTSADSIIVRTVPGGGDAAVTVVGLGQPDPAATALGAGVSPGALEDDDADEVRLWLQIPRSVGSGPAHRGESAGGRDIEKVPGGEAG